MAILPAMLAMEGYFAQLLENARRMKENLLEQERLLKEAINRNSLESLRNQFDGGDHGRGWDEVVRDWNQIVPGLSGQAPFSQGGTGGRNPGAPYTGSGSYNPPRG